MQHRNRTLFSLVLTLSLIASLGMAAEESVDLNKIAASHSNRFYVTNRAPLVPSPLVELPIGAVRPQGWLLVCLQRQRDGLSGHLGEISAWLQKKDNAWLSPVGKGQFGWEEVPYWLRGYIQLAYLLDDPKMIAESQIWIEGVAP